MAAFSQLRLLLHKNWTLRRRQPVILSLELFWPVVVILIVVAIRYAIPPTAKEDCYYRARAQPSAGLLPFVQSYVCTINNTCEDAESYEEIPSYPDSYLNKMLPQVMPLFKNPDLMGLIEHLPSSLKLTRLLVDAVLQPDVRKILGSDFQVQDFFKDPERLKSLVTKDVLSPFACDALLTSSLNFPKIMSSVSKWSEPNFWACSSSSLQNWLVFPNQEDQRFVSNEICSLTSGQWSSLAPIILQELNWIDVAEKLQVLLRSFGNPEEGNSLANIFRMADSFVNRKDLLNIANKLENMKGVFRLVPALVQLMNDLRTTKIDFEFLRTVVSDIYSITGDKNVSLHLDSMLNFTEKVWKWMDEGSNPKYTHPLPLGSVLENKSGVEEYFQYQLGLSAKEVQAVLLIDVSPEILEDLLAKDGDASHIFCISSDVLLTNGGSHLNPLTTAIQKLRHLLCESTSTRQQLKDKSNLFRLARAASTDVFDSKNLTASVDALESSLRFFSHSLLVRFNGSIPELDVVWKLAASVLHVLLRNDWTHTSTNNQTLLSLVPLLDVIPAVLPQRFHQTLARGFVSAHVFLTLANNISRITMESDSLFVDDIRSHLPLVKRILRLGPNAVRTIFTLLSNETKLKQLIDSSERLDKIFCNRAKLQELFADYSTNTSQFLAALCKPGVASFLEGLSRGMGVSLAAGQIEETISQFRNTTAQKFYDVSVANFTSLAREAQTLLNHISSVNSNSREKWRRLIRDLGSEFRDEQWQRVWLTFDSESVPVLTSLYMKLLHKQLRESSSYEEIARVALALSSTLGPTFEAITRISNYIKTDRIYWPIAIETFLRTLQDNAKFQRLLRVDDWSNVTCTRATFWEVLVIPLSVNANELQRFLCNVTTSLQRFVRSEEWADFLYSKSSPDSISKSRSIPDEAIWTNLTNQMQVLYGAYRQLVVESRNRQYNLRELLQLAKNTFVNMSQEKKAQLGLVTLFESFDLIDAGLQQQKLRTWSMLKRWLHDADILFGFITRKLNTISATGQIVVDDIFSGLPILTKVLTNALASVTPVIDVVSETFSTRLDQLLTRILHVENWSRVPCRGISLAEFFDFPAEAETSLRTLETELCHNYSLILKEFSRHPLIRAFEGEYHHNGTSNADPMLTWRPLANTILNFQDIWKKGFPSKLTLFPDVSNFSSTGLQDAVTAARNLTRVKHPEQFRLLLRSTDVLVSFLARETKGHRNWETQAVNILLKSIATVNIVFEEIDNTLTQIIGGQRNLVSLLGSDIDHLLFSVMENLDKYLYASIASITDLSFPLKLHRLMPSNREWSILEICDHTSKLDDLIMIPTGEALNISTLIAPLCQKNFTGEIFTRDKIYSTIEKIRYLWKSGANNSNNSITHLFNAISNATAQMTTYRSLTPPPELQWGFDKKMFSRTRWRKFQADVIHLVTSNEDDKINLVLQRSQAAMATAILFLAEDPKLLSSLEIMSGLMNMIRRASKVAAGTDDYNGTAISFSNLFQNTSQLWNKAVKWFDDHGVEFMNAFLNTVAENPEKIIVLFSKPSPWQQWCDQDLNIYLTFPPNVTGNATAQQEVCTIKWQLFPQQLRAEGCQSGSNETAFAPCFASSYSELFSVIQDLSAKNGTADFLRDKLIVWKDMVLHRYNQYFKTNRSTDAMFWIRKVTGIFDSALQTSGLGRWIVATQHILNWINTKLKLLRDSKFDVKTLMANYPELMKLLQTVDQHILPFTKSWIFTMYSRPYKIADLLRHPTASICNITLSDALEVQNTSLNPDHLKNDVCQLNSSLIVDDLIAFLDWRSLKAAVLIPSGNARSSSSETLNQTIIAIEQMYDIIRDLSKMNYSEITLPFWFNVSSWEDIGSFIANYFSSPRLSSFAISLLDYFLGQKGYGGILSLVQEWLEAVSKRTELILKSGNEIGVESFFTGFPTMQLVLSPVILHLPLFTKTFVTFSKEESSEYQKLMNHKSWSSFCNSSSQAKLMERFNSTDGQTWFGNLCKINTTQFTNELGEFLMIHFYEDLNSRLTNGTGQFNGTQVVVSFIEVAKNMQTMIRSSRLHREVEPFFNNTVWSNVFTEMYNRSGFSQSSNNSELPEDISKFLKTLQNSSLFSNPALVEKLTSLQNVTQWVLLKLKVFSGSTKDEVFPTIKRVISIVNHHLIDLIEESGRLLLQYPQSPQLLSGNLGVFCNLNASEDYEMNVTFMHLLLCTVDHQVLSLELKKMIDADSLVESFKSLTSASKVRPAAAPFNVTELYTNIRDLTQNMDLILKKEVQQASNYSWLKPLEWKNIWKRMETLANNTLQQPFFWVRWLDVPLARIQNSTKASEIVSALQKVGGLVDWLQQLSIRMPVKGNTTWSSILGQFPHLESILSIFSHNAVEFVETLVTAAVRNPQQLSHLFKQSANATLCIGQKISTFLNGSGDFETRLKPVMEQLCTLDVVAMRNEIQEVVAWPLLRRVIQANYSTIPAVNTSFLIHMAKGVQKVFQTLKTSDFHQPFLNLSSEWRNKTAWQDMANRLQKEMTAANFSHLSIKDWMPLFIRSALGNGNFSRRDRERNLITAHVYLKLGTNIVKMLLASNSTSSVTVMKVLYEGRSNVQLLIDVLDNLPDVLSIFVSTLMHPLKAFNLLANITSGNHWHQVLCEGQDHFVLPKGVKQEVMQILNHFICSSNFKELFTQLDPMDTEKVIKMQQLPFDEVQFIQDVDEFLWLIDDVILKRKEMGKPIEPLQNAWEPFIKRMEELSQLVTSADWASLKTALEILGPILETKPMLTRPIYHRMLALLHNVNIQLDNVLNTTEGQSTENSTSVMPRDGSSLSVNLNNAAQLVLWWSGCTVEGTTEEHNNCTDDDLKQKMFWEREKNFTSPCIPLKFKELIEQMDNHNTNNSDPLTSIPVPWKLVVNEIQKISSKLWLLTEHSSNISSALFKWQCNGLDVRKSIQRMFYTAISLVPKNPELDDIRDALAAAFSIFDGLYDRNLVPLSTFVRDPSAFEYYLVSDVGLPSKVAHNFPSQTLIDANDEGWKLVHNQTRVCTDRRLWARAVSSRGSTLDQHLRKVFCNSKSIVPFLDTSKMGATANNQNSLASYSHDVGTSREKILNRNLLLESSFLILRLLDRFPYWRSVSGLLQPANDRLSQVLSYTQPFSDPGFSWYHLLRNATLFKDFVEFATTTMPNNGFPSSKPISYYFSTHPNETQYFCGNSSRKQFARSIITSELGIGIGNVTALFEILCREDPNKWNDLLILEAEIPKQKVSDVLHSAMTLLPENSDWNRPRSLQAAEQELNWNQLRLNTYRFANLMQNVPPQFVPEFRWSFWKEFFEDSLPAALPNIAKIIGLRACSLIEHKSTRKDFSMAAIIFHIISNQVQGFPGLQSVTCELPNMNLPTLYDQLMQYGGIMETIQGIYNITTHVTQNYTCNEMVDWLGVSTEQVLFYINYNQQPKNQRHMDQCYLRMGQTTAFMELDRYLQLFMDGLDLVQELSNGFAGPHNGTTIPLSLSSVIRSVQDAMNVLETESSVFVPFHSLQKKERSLSTVISAHLDQNIALTLMDSDINLSTLNLINFSIPELSTMLCNQRQFYKVVRLHIETEVSYYELRRAICDSNVTAIATAIMSSISDLEFTEQEFNLSDLRNEASYKWANVYEVGNRIDAIFHQMSVLSSTAKRLRFGTNITKITVAESVFGLLHESSLQAFIEGVAALRTYLHPLIVNTVLDDDLGIILTGLKSLENITNEKLIPLRYNVQKFFTNFTAIVSNLREVFGLSAENTNAFGQSYLTLNGLFRVPIPFSTFKEVTCDVEQLANILSVSNTNLLETLVDSLCNRNDSALDSFIELCADNIDYYFLVRQVFLGGLHKLGQSAFLNGEETEGTIQLLPKLGNLLPNITALLKSLHYMEEFSDVLEEFQSAADIMQAQWSNASIKPLSQTALRQQRQAALPRLKDYFPSLLRVTGNLFCGKPLRNFLDDFSIIGDTNIGVLTAQDQKALDELPTRFCKNLYTQILQMKAGPVIWAYLKPLLRGKILYAPHTLLTEKIMHQANGTLEQIASFTQKLNQWGSGTETLRTFNQSRLEQLETALNLSLVRELMEQLAGKDLTMLTSDLSVLLQEVRRFDKVFSLVEVLAEAMQCLSLDRFIGVSSEIELENMAQKLFADDSFMGGVVFLNVDRMRQTRNVDEGKLFKMPSEIAYKIRMDIDNVPSTSRLKQWFWRPGPEDNFANDLRYFRGFVQLQDILDLAIIQIQAGNNVILPPTYTQQFPYPCFFDDEFGFFLKGLVPLIITLAWIFLIAFFIRERVLERELSLEQTMRMMGLRSGIHWCAWFISSFIVMVIVVSCLVLALRFGNILPLTNVALVYLFLLDYAFAVVMFCYMMSTCFNSATVAALTSVIVYLISYLPFIIILTLETELVFWQKVLSNVVMSTSFSYGCLYIARYEEQNVGLQWSSTWTSPIPEDDFSFAWSCIMLLADGILYFFMGVVISHCRSGSRYLWSSATKQRSSKARNNSKRNSGSVHLAFCENDYTNEDHLSSLAELQLGDLKKTETVGLSLNHLHKVFDQGTSRAKTAVDHLSLDFFENQITTLLGQNGAGKTTTIHLLTGMFSPTSGSCFIYGQDVQKNFLSIRQNLGVCPQKNVLFPLFSVREHLEFYCKLKGTFAAKQICDDVDRMLDSMNLWHKQDELVCNLSDGTRRRLCVAIAFIGGSRTIILDEPTSGVDPVARRKIWDLIVAHKHGRTILLTTHHMDEADILSDRVAILHQGKLLCCGSPHFLKTQFGSGYQVTVTKRTGDFDSDSDSGAGSFTSSNLSAVTCDSSALLLFLRRFVPNARLVEDHGLEVVYTLPYFSDQGLQNKYDILFSELENNQTALGIGSYGLSCATLEEVFLTVCAEADAGQPITPRDPKNWMLSNNPQIITRQRNMVLNRRRSSKISLKDLQLQTEDGFKFNSPSRSDYYLSGCSLMLHQLSALLKKRSCHTLRNLSSFLSTIVLPCLFVALAMGFSLLRSVGHKQEVALQLTPLMYGPHSYSFLSLASDTSNSSSLLLEGLLDQPYHPVVHNCSDERGATPICDKWPLLAWSQERCGCNVDSSLKCTEKPDASLVHYLVQNENFVFNLTGINISLWILNSNEEFREKRYGGITIGPKSKINDVEEFAQENMKVWYNNKGYHALPSYLNTLHNAQLRTSMHRLADNSTTFKITTYNHPIILSGEQLSKETILQHVADVGIALVFVIAFSFIPASFIVFVVQERVREEKRLQFVSGVSPFLYWAATYLWNLVLASVAVGLAIALIAVIGLPTYVAKLNLPALACLLFLYCWATTPLMYILEKLFMEASLANMVLFCINVFIGVNTMVCTLLLSIFQNPLVVSTVLPITRWVFLVFPQYALGGSLVELAKNSIQAEIFARFGRDTYSNPFNIEITGLHMIVLAVQGLIFFIINFLLEYHCTTCCARNSRETRDVLIAEDTDVLLEKKRVHEESNHDLLRLYNLTKVYSGRSLAVDSICLGIPRGECFGLLGVNGAGKTTAFRMMTNQLKPTSGKVLFKRHSIANILSSGSRALGFCPQANALDDLLTAEELLRIYGKFRGIPSAILPQVVHRTLEKFNLQAYAKRKTQSYSLGIKRKLCVAISVLGNPELVLMDEPTSGMDPSSRRHVWTNILQIIKDKRSVILTSHSMEECDNLCSRIAIMVNGKFQCLGGPQYLKHKFGEGYTLKLRVHEDVLDWGHIIAFIHEHFPLAILKARHCNTIEFLVPTKHIMLSQIFACMESQQDALGVEDFSVSQTTLDQVFVNFVRQQSDGTDERIDKQSRFGHLSNTPQSGNHSYTNSSCSLDDEGITSKDHQPMTVQIAHRRTPTLSRYSETDFDTTKF